MKDSLRHAIAIGVARQMIAQSGHSAAELAKQSEELAREFEGIGFNGKARDHRELAAAYRAIEGAADE